MVAVGLSAGPPAVAHDFWIEPDRFLVADDGPVALTLRVGEHYKGESVPYIDDWIDRFELHDGQGARPISGQIGDDPAGRVAPRSAGASWVAYQSRDDFVELPPDKFAEYLRLEGMESILPLRQRRGLAERPAREYYVRCVKALLWAPGADGVAVDAPLGLTLEIVPEGNPYALAAGEPLVVRLLYQGQPQPGLLVKALTREQPEREQRLRSDAAGRVRIRLDRPGSWMVKTVHMVAVEDDPYGEWRSYWASLTFARE